MKIRALLPLPLLTACATSSVAPATESADPFERLLEGNRRFAAGSVTHRHDVEAQRKDLAEGQTPFAIVLTCADSRVAPEFLFDQALGDLFVCRVAGNTPGPLTLGSMEYAAEHLHSSVLVVMGHERCGAVKAAMDGGEAPGHIGALVHAIQPALAQSRHETGDALDDAVRANVRYVVAFIRRESPILAHLEQEGKLKIVGTRYDLDTGEVTLVE